MAANSLRLAELILQPANVGEKSRHPDLPAAGFADRLQPNPPRQPIEILTDNPQLPQHQLVGAAAQQAFTEHQQHEQHETGHQPRRKHRRIFPQEPGIKINWLGFCVIMKSKTCRNRRHNRQTGSRDSLSD